jgi:cyclase
MPTLLLHGNGLVKTVKFKNPGYIGDPINTARIFNEMEVDELILLDIEATVARRHVQFELVRDIVSECFMPICYGGGVRATTDFERLFRAGVEKVSVSSLLFSDPAVVAEAVRRYGSQSVVGTIDVRKSRLGGAYTVVTHRGTRKVGRPLPDVLDHLDRLKVGEVMVNNIDREGTWNGFDSGLVRTVADRMNCPVIALGGAGSLEDVGAVVREGHASAVAVGSLAVFQARGMGVLVNFPSVSRLKDYLP